MIRVELVNYQGYLRLEYYSQYAAGAMPVNTPEDLVRVIEEVCGKGSYCFYYRDNDRDCGMKRAIEYSMYKDYPNLPRITYWQQGVKTQVIEQARGVAKEVWGDIPEMEIGWLENQCKTYID